MSDDPGLAPSTELRIPNDRGTILAGTLDGQLGPTLAISCHGMFSNRQGRKHQLLAAELRTLGVPCFRFDFTGLGDSEGDLFSLTLTREMHDLQAVIEHFAARGVQRFALFGSSLGGAVALLAAARDERIIAVATLAGLGHPELIEERHLDLVMQWHRLGQVDSELGPIGKSYFDDALTHDVISAVQVLRAPVLVVHGALDDVIPVSDAHDIAAAARHVRLEIVEGADHRFSKEVHARPAMRLIAGFLAHELASVEQS